MRGGLRPQVQAGGRGVSFVNAAGGAVVNYAGLKVWDADGHELAAAFEAEAEELRLRVEAGGARYPLTIDPLAQQAYLKASNTEGGDNFGQSVAISGDTIVVGANEEDSYATGVNGDQSDNSALQSGAVYVFGPNQAPVAQCKNVTVVADDSCTADASINDGSYDPDVGDSITLTQSPAGPYRLGTTTVTLTVTDSFGASSSCQAVVTVVDQTSPTITLTGAQIAFWSPNHQYETISVAQLVASAFDNCGGNLTGNVVIAQVSSDEPDDGLGDGSTINDIVIAPDCKSVQLRAERQGGGNGRVYTITFKVSDAEGNTTTATAKVTVPKSQGNNAAIDDGPVYTKTGSCP